MPGAPISDAAVAAAEGVPGGAGSRVAGAPDVYNVHQRSRGLSVKFTDSSRLRATVTRFKGNTMIRYDTDIEAGTCTCGEPHLLCLPCCPDLVAHARKATFDLQTLVKPEATTKAWKKQYKCMRSIEELNPPGAAAIRDVVRTALSEPPMSMRQRGRKSKHKRHKGALENVRGKKGKTGW